MEVHWPDKRDFWSNLKNKRPYLTLGGGNWLQGLEETIYFLYLVLLKAFLQVAKNYKFPTDKINRNKFVILANKF